MARTSGVYCFGTSQYDCGQTNQVCSIFHRYVAVAIRLHRVRGVPDLSHCMCRCAESLRRCTRSCVVDSDCAGTQTCQWGACETPYSDAEQIELSTAVHYHASHMCARRTRTERDPHTACVVVVAPCAVHGGIDGQAARGPPPQPLERFNV
jgi:hypothetical protein